MVCSDATYANQVKASSAWRILVDVSPFEDW
jgi:hypothetical protein